MPPVYSEITQLEVGDAPNGSLPISPLAGLSSMYWQEMSRFVVYEEAFDDSSRTFSAPQHPAVEFVQYENLARIFKSGRLRALFTSIQLKSG